MINLSANHGPNSSSCRRPRSDGTPKSTSLALLLEPDPPLLLRNVVVLVGAVGVPGNLTPYADANSFHDPAGADLVLGGGFTLTLVGLNATEAARADGARLDALAAAITVDPGPATYEQMIVGVELGGVHPRGQTLTDLRLLSSDAHIANGFGTHKQDRPPVLFTQVSGRY